MWPISMAALLFWDSNPYDREDLQAGVCAGTTGQFESNCVVATPSHPIPPGESRLQACPADYPDGSILVGGGCFVAANQFNKACSFS